MQCQVLAYTPVASASGCALSILGVMMHISAAPVVHAHGCMKIRQLICKMLLAESSIWGPRAGHEGSLGFYKTAHWAPSMRQGASTHTQKCHCHLICFYEPRHVYPSVFWFVHNIKCWPLPQYRTFGVKCSREPEVLYSLVFNIQHNLEFTLMFSIKESLWCLCTPRLLNYCIFSYIPQRGRRWFGVFLKKKK